MSSENPNFALSRRRLLEMGAGAAAGLALGGAAVVPAEEVSAASLYGLTTARQAEAPRNRTLILVGNGGEQPNTFPDVTNQNPYLQTIRTRSGWQLCYEPLAFYNMLTGEEMMWLGESVAYNADFTELTVTLRPDGAWSDATPFTARDVAFTLNMLRDPANAALDWSTLINQWVASAEAVDDRIGPHHADRAEPALFLQLPDPVRRHRDHDPAGAHLGRAGPERVRQLRPRPGLAGGHRRLQTGAIDARAEGLGVAPRLVGGAGRLPAAATGASG